MPVTKYTADWLKKSGANTPVEGLRQLPSFVGNASTENNSNGGSGAATINLRALGSENVLILINGRRAFLGSGFDGVDVNLIPLSGLQRAEVLKDGASSIYGSDAVAGVVNFIMWNDTHDNGPLFEGAEFEIRYGNTTDHDANVRQAWIRGGVTGLDGKVAIFASAEYYDRAGIYSRDRYISSTGGHKQQSRDQCQSRTVVLPAWVSAGSITIAPSLLAACWFLSRPRHSHSCSLSDNLFSVT